MYYNVFFYVTIGCFLACQLVIFLSIKGYLIQINPIYKKYLNIKVNNINYYFPSWIYWIFGLAIINLSIWLDYPLDFEPTNKIIIVVVNLLLLLGIILFFVLYWKTRHKNRLTKPSNKISVNDFYIDNNLLEKNWKKRISKINLNWDQKMNSNIYTIYVMEVRSINVYYQGKLISYQKLAELCFYNLIV